MPINLSDLKPKIWTRAELDRIDLLSDEQLEAAIVGEAFLQAYSMEDVSNVRAGGDTAWAERMLRVIEATDEAKRRRSSSVASKKGAA